MPSVQLGDIMNETQDLVQQLMSMLESTQDDEPDCQHVYNVMDYAAELKARGVDLSVALPELEQHFAVCKCCQHEFEALVKIIAE